MRIENGVAADDTCFSLAKIKAGDLRPPADLRVMQRRTYDELFVDMAKVFDHEVRARFFQPVEVVLVASLELLFERQIGPHAAQTAHGGFDALGRKANCLLNWRDLFKLEAFSSNDCKIRFLQGFSPIHRAIQPLLGGMLAFSLQRIRE